MTIDWLTSKTEKSSIDCRCNKFIDWLISKKINWLIVIFANSRSFSLIHDASSESKMQSSFSKKKFSFRWFEDALCKFFIQFTKIRFVVSWFFSKKFSFRWFENALCKFFNQFTKIRFVVSWFLSKKISHFDDFILFIRVFRRAICFDKRFNRMSISLAKFKTRNLLCKKQWIIVIANW